MPTVNLASSVSILPGVGEQRQTQLNQLGILSLQDLLLYLPYRYVDASQIVPIAHLILNQTATIQAQVEKVHALKTRFGKSMIVVTISDKSGKITLTFFNQPYVQTQLKINQAFAFTGQVREYKGKLTLTNPTYEPLDKDSVHTGRILPIYSQSAQIGVKFLRRLLFNAIIKAQLRLPEYLPDIILQDEQLLDRIQATKQVHFPDTIQLAKQARQRLAFDEIWQLFSDVETEQAKLQQQQTFFQLDYQQALEFLDEFKKILPFELTTTQLKAITQIYQELSQPYPTKHLVQGEVGSGKTHVAASVLLSSAVQKQQALYLAPTTVLAQQHYQVIAPLAQKIGVQVKLITSSQQKNNSIDSQGEVIIGTHALIQNLKNYRPSVVITDEEHRFGVKQREFFWQQKSKPHLVSMTATPIPRTLASLLFGDNKTSFLQLIAGQEKKIKTKLLDRRLINKHLDWLAQKIETDHIQVFLIAPFIEASTEAGFEKIMDTDTLFKLAQKKLKNCRLELLTGQQKDTQKSETLDKFLQNQADVLVATPVIEVGIDLPQASAISIFSAERFGLAQLHQLRGRVGRRGQSSWCFLIPSAGTEESALTRLKKLEQINNGQQLAELDLSIRGAGEFLGTRQSGWDSLNIASWYDLDTFYQVKRLRKQQNLVQ